MSIVYCSRSAGASGMVQKLQAGRMELDELLTVADVVSVHCPYSDATHHLVGAKQPFWMKDTSYLVNTASSMMARMTPR